MSKFLSLEKFKEAAKNGTQPEAGIRKEFIAEIDKSEADESRTLVFTISTDSVDRHGDSVAIDGWTLENFRKNPVVLWAHDYRTMPVAKSLSEWVEGNKLKSRAQFTPKEMSRFNDTVFEMYKQGFMSAVSVGFAPKKWVWAEADDRRFGIDFVEQELLEFSAVPVPANAEALIEARSAGIDLSYLKDWATATLTHLKEDSIQALDSKALAEEVVERLKSHLDERFVRSTPKEQVPDSPSYDSEALKHLEALKLRRRRLSI